MDPTEVQLARAIYAAINGVEQLPGNSPRRAALQLFGGIAEHCSDLGYSEDDLNETLYRIFREKESTFLSNGGGPRE